MTESVATGMHPSQTQSSSWPAHSAADQAVSTAERQLHLSLYCPEDDMVDDDDEEGTVDADHVFNRMAASQESQSGFDDGPAGSLLIELGAGFSEPMDYTVVSLQPTPPPSPEGLQHYLQNLLGQEHHVASLFVEGQRTIQQSHQAVVVEFLTELQEHFECHRGTLFLAISVLRRVLLQLAVGLDELQLAAVTCFALAAKIEEGNCVSFAELEYACDGACPVQDIVHSELVLWKLLEHQVSTPHSFQFAEIYQHMFSVPDQVFNFALMLLELSLIEPALGAVRPSILAMAALELAYMQVPELIMPAHMAETINVQAEDLLSPTMRLQIVLELFVRNPHLSPHLRVRYPSVIHTLE